MKFPVENPAHPSTIQSAWMAVLPPLLEMLPEGYAVRGGRIVRTDPNRPEVLELRSEKGNPVRVRTAIDPASA